MLQLLHFSHRSPSPSLGQMHLGLTIAAGGPWELGKSVCLPSSEKEMTFNGHGTCRQQLRCKSHLSPGVDRKLKCMLLSTSICPVKPVTWTWSLNHMRLTLLLVYKQRVCTAWEPATVHQQWVLHILVPLVLRSSSLVCDKQCPCLRLTDIRAFHVPGHS